MKKSEITETLLKIGKFCGIIENDILYGGEIMKASYKKLWKLLVDKEMSKGDLHKKSGLSSSTMTKLRKGEDVSMEALRKICVALNCNIADIVEFVPDNTES